MSDVITTEVRVCTGETVNVEALKIVDIIKAGIVACTDDQFAILAQALCDSYKAGKDYTAAEVSKVAKFAVAVDGKVAELSTKFLETEKTLNEVKPTIEILQNFDLGMSEKVKALTEILSNDNIALNSLLKLQLELVKTNDNVTNLTAVVDTNTADIAKNTTDIAELKAGQQSDVLCKVSDAFSNLSENLKKIFDCDARKAKLTDALGCINKPYTPVGEYQWAANPADLMTAPAMVMPVETVLPTETVLDQPVVEAMPEVVTEPVVVPDVIAPTPVVEPTYVVTSETVDNVLFEVLSDGNMRKTDVDGTVTTTNSMGDLVE
jgi:hypothetical protein